MTRANREADGWDIEAEIAWIREEKDEDKMSNGELQADNKKILHALKMMEHRLDRELELQRKNINLQETQELQSNHEKVNQENMKINETVIKGLEKEAKKLRERREELKNGVEAKLNTKKYELEKKGTELKSELRKLKLEEKELNKRLEKHGNVREPESLSENQKLEEELRVYSIKYMKLLEKYNRGTEQLAMVSNTV